MVLYMSSQREIQKQNKISCETAKNAGVAQLVEQLICNQQVGGSSPSTSSKPKSPETLDLSGVLGFLVFSPQPYFTENAHQKLAFAR